MQNNHTFGDIKVVFSSGFRLVVAITLHNKTKQLSAYMFSKCKTFIGHHVNVFPSKPSMASFSLAAFLLHNWKCLRIDRRAGENSDTSGTFIVLEFVHLLMDQSAAWTVQRRLGDNSFWHFCVLVSTYVKTAENALFGAGLIEVMR